MTESAGADNGPVNAYGFVGSLAGSHAQFLESLTTVPAVRFVGPVVGGSAVVVAAEADDLLALEQTVVPAVRVAGGVDVSWTTALGGAVMIGTVPKRKDPPRGALIRMRARSVAQAMDELSELFAGLNGDDSAQQGYSFGAIRTYGAGTDVVADLGAPDEASLATVLGQLDGLEHGRVTDVCLSAFAETGWWRG